jgi:hypothetical protein
VNGLGEYPKLAAYVARGEVRPAYRRAFAVQLAINGPARQNSPTKNPLLVLRKNKAAFYAPPSE